MGCLVSRLQGRVIASLPTLQLFLLVAAHRVYRRGRTGLEV